MNSLRSDRAATVFRCRLVQQVPEANVTSKHRTLPEQRKKEKEMRLYENGYSLAPPPILPLTGFGYDANYLSDLFSTQMFGHRVRMGFVQIVFYGNSSRPPFTAFLSTTSTQ